MTAVAVATLARSLAARQVGRANALLRALNLALVAAEIAGRRRRVRTPSKGLGGTKGAAELTLRIASTPWRLPGTRLEGSATAQAVEVAHKP